MTCLIHLLWSSHPVPCRSRDEVASAVAAVSKKLPRRIKRKRPITTTDGTPLGGMEEYYDYVFPEEAGAAPNLKLLEAAMRWKRQKLMGGGAAQPEQQQQQKEEEDSDPEQQKEQQQDEGDGQQQDDDQGDDDGY